MIACLFSLRAQTLFLGVVAPCGGVDNRVPQLHATTSASLDYLPAINYTICNPNLQSIKEEFSGQFRNKFNFKTVVYLKDLSFQV